MQKPKLLPQSPPYVDKTDPRYIAWRQDLQEEAIEHLHQCKLETPNLKGGSQALINVTMGGLGLLGLVSPETVSAVLHALLSRP